MTRPWLAGLAAAAWVGCGVPSQPPGPAPTSPPRNSHASAIEPIDGHHAGKPSRSPHTGAVPAGTCFVDFLDVGSGLAVFVRCKDGAGKELNILYDAGTQHGKANGDVRTVYLLENGLGFMRGSTIHHLIQSHPHFDHHSDMPGDKGVIALYDVKNVWDPAMVYDSNAYRCFLKAVTTKQETTDLIYHPARKCPTTRVLRTLKCDGESVGFFKQAQVKPYTAPSIDTPTVLPYDVKFGDSITGKILYSDPEASGPNEAALVLKLSMYGIDMLLTADEEAGPKRVDDPNDDPHPKSVEAFLVDPARSHLLPANIIQVPHHGSLTSSRNAFKDAVILKRGVSVQSYAVISSGDRPYAGITLPDDTQVRSWSQKLGAGKLLLTTKDDSSCKTNTISKIGPTGDDTVTGCTSVEFKIEKSGTRGKITKVMYWPAGPERP